MEVERTFDPAVPDINDRICTDCGMLFTPFSMAVDVNAVVDSHLDDEGNMTRRVLPEEVIMPPVLYQCLSCRSKSAVR